MCILFLYTDSTANPNSTVNIPGRNNKSNSDNNNNNKSKKSSGYKLILAANRDEKYSRPSKVAHFWGCSPDIIAGKDAEPGKEGGTWLGMTKTGKIGALLNMPPKPTTSQHNVEKSQKLGRGFLVTDYLKSNLTGLEYGNVLRNKNSAKLYHSFNLLTIDLCNPDKENGLAVSYFSNYSPWINVKMKLSSGAAGQTHQETDDHLAVSDHDYTNDHYQITLGSNGIHSFGNCPYNVPLLKLKDGEEKFSKLIQSQNENDDEEQLIDGLLSILKCSHKHYPDPELMTIAEMRSEEFAQGLSSRYVNIPWKNYGSRTHTIILVDTQNKVKYMEWTMKEPIVDPQNPEWVISKREFTLQTDEEEDPKKNVPVPPANIITSRKSSVVG